MICAQKMPLSMFFWLVGQFLPFDIILWDIGNLENMSKRVNGEDWFFNLDRG